MRNFALLTLLLALLAAGCAEEPQVEAPVRPVRVYTVNGEAHTEVRTFPGKVEAAQQASLAFRISGEIVNLAVKQGDSVVKGQLIALLDQRDYQAAVSDLQAQLTGARSVLNEARLNIERNQTLLKENIIAQSAYDSAHSTYESARATVLSLEQSLKRARLNLQYTRLSAPFSGTIAQTHVDNHEFVEAKEGIVQLENSSMLDVVINMPESYWVRVKGANDNKLAKAVARFASLPGQSFPLKLKEYQTTANSATQTYEVTLSMQAPEGLGITPGMTAEVEGSLLYASGEDHPVVPFTCVAGSVEEGQFVWVLDDSGTVHERPVTVGGISGDMIAVLSGVEHGETVVAAGVNYLREGQQVRVLEGRIGGRE